MKNKNSVFDFLYSLHFHFLRIFTPPVYLGNRYRLTYSPALFSIKNWNTWWWIKCTQEQKVNYFFILSDIGMFEQVYIFVWNPLYSSYIPLLMPPPFPFHAQSRIQHTHKPTNTYTLTLSLSLSLTHTHTLSHSHSLSHSLSLSLSLIRRLEGREIVDGPWQQGAVTAFMEHINKVT